MKKSIISLAIGLLALIDSIVAADVVTISEFRIAAGETRNVNVTLDNETEYVGFQFDLYLPDSISIESYSVNRSRIPESTTLSMSKQEDGSYRFIAAAMGASPITETSGTIVSLRVKAARGLSIGEETGYFRNVKLSKSNATGPTYPEFSFPVQSICYVVRYYVDGLLYQTDSVGYGLPIIPVQEPTKEGYTFSGWSEIPATMPANDVEVIGTFSINSYKLIYKVDGEVYKTDTLVFETSVTALEEPVKEGYSFSGWSQIPATMPAHDVEVTGKFEPLPTFVVTFRNYNNTVLQVDTLYYGLMPSYRGGTPTREPSPQYTYTFSGWSPEIKAVTDDVTYTAVYDSKDILNGDADVDGIIGINDVIMTIDASLGNLAASFNKYAADLDGDGNITINDVIMLIDLTLNQ